MKDKTWLWISLGALALVSVCCVGVLLGGAIARQDNAAQQTEATATTQPVARAPESVPTEQSIEPTLAPTMPPTSPPTATAVPTPPPPPAPPPGPPPSSDLQALVDYANAMKPLLDEAAVLVQRDGEILEASEGGNDAVLCDGRLAADHVAMSQVVRRVRIVTPPGEASVIHDLVLRSGDAWTEALDNVGQFCNTSNQLYKIPAVLKFWEAAATLQDAANRFWLLLLAKGVEDWVQR